MSIAHPCLVASIADSVDVVVNELPLIATVWITLVGGCLGSFMNVVIYRLPVGMSLVHPPSRCPNCEKPIRARDNLPVIGWLMLRGRCRDCGEAISARYPLVEGVVASTFLILWLVDVAWPGEMLATYVRLGVFGLDALLMCSLICMALIEFDKQVVPWRLAVFPLVTLLVVIWQWPFFVFYLQRYQYEVSRLGGVAGGLLLGGALAWLNLGGWQGVRNRRGPILMGALTGAYLSWTGVAMIGVATAALFWVTRRRKKLSDAAHWSLLFTAVTLLALVSVDFVSGVRAEELLVLRRGMVVAAIALTTISGWMMGHD